MPTIDLQALRDKINAQNIAALANTTGLPYFQILRFARNVTAKPSFELVTKLYNHLESGNEQAKK